MNKRLLTKNEALILLVKIGCSKQLIKHCKAVEVLAVNIAKACKKRGLNVDIQLISIGALLHDIGRTKTHGINHVIEGAQIAKLFNLPDSIVSIIECHIGGGITIVEAEKLGWQKKQYLPKTLEGKIVAYADKLIEGSQRVKIERTIKKLSRELGETHPAIERVKKLHYEISSLIGDLF